MSMKSSLWQTVPVKRPKSAKFDLTHDRKFSANMGYMYPILVKEMLPGDRWSGQTDALLRCAPMLAPEMTRIRICIDYYAVPYRLIWSDSEDFFTKGRLGTSAPVAPYWNLNDTTKDYTANGTLCDHIGLPNVQAQTVVGDHKISALPFRAYQLVYDEYYRNQNLKASINMSIASGEVAIGAELDKLIELRKCHWGLDRYTSALPFPQRGDDVLIPMSGEGELNYQIPAVVTRSVPPLPPAPADGDIKSVASALQDSAGNAITIMPFSSVEFTNAAFTIVDLRRAARLQEWLEKNALAGGRYNEQLKAHWGVISSDARLQRPEYLGGGRASMIISEVLSTATDADIATVPPQGNMAGHGVSSSRSNRFRYRAEEHTMLIGILRVLPYTAYQQGLPKMFQRFDVFDYPFPEFAHIGEEEIFNKEVYFDSEAGGDPAGVFGFTPRYSDWKTAESSVHGEFKETLNFWHMGRIFAAEQNLNEAFVTADPTNRIFAVAESEQLYCMFTHMLHVVRALPYFGQGRL